MRSPFGPQAEKDLTNFDEPQTNGDVIIQDLRTTEQIQEAREDAEITHSVEELLNEFRDLLNAFNIDSKLKNLWFLTYKNAMIDRKNALIMWDDLSNAVFGKPEMHTIHGDKLAKYMERAEKANGQLLKLSELIQKMISESQALATEEDIGSLKTLMETKRKNVFGKA